MGGWIYKFRALQILDIIILLSVFVSLLGFSLFTSGIGCFWFRRLNTNFNYESIFPLKNQCSSFFFSLTTIQWISLALNLPSFSSHYYYYHYYYYYYYYYLFLYSYLFIYFYLQGLGPYSTSIKKVEKEIKEMAKKVNDLCGMTMLPFLFFFKLSSQLITLNF